MNITNGISNKPNLDILRNNTPPDTLSKYRLV